MRDTNHIQGLFAGIFTSQQIIEQFKAAYDDGMAYSNFTNRDHDALGGTEKTDHEFQVDPIDRAKIDRKKSTEPRYQLKLVA